MEIPLKCIAREQVETERINELLKSFMCYISLAE